MLIDNSLKIRDLQSYEAKLHRVRLEQASIANIQDRQRRHEREIELREAAKLNDYNEAQRVLRNQLIYNYYKDNELYEYHLKLLRIAKDISILKGTNVDSFD